LLIKDLDRKSLISKTKGKIEYHTKNPILNNNYKTSKPLKDSNP